MLGVGLLLLAASLLSAAIVKRHEGLLLGGVVAYAGTAIYIAEHDVMLFTPAILLAGFLALVGLARFATGYGRERG
ncbi:MAG: hypothetical protein HY985_19110 [Magnetospirillum sp.]|nr:hypothetical protein [Magnetospirillum sp.]